MTMLNAYTAWLVNNPGLAMEPMSWPLQLGQVVADLPCTICECLVS